MEEINPFLVQNAIQGEGALTGAISRRRKKKGSSLPTDTHTECRSLSLQGITNQIIRQYVSTKTKKKSQVLCAVYHP